MWTHQVVRTGAHPQRPAELQRLDFGSTHPCGDHARVVQRFAVARSSDQAEPTDGEDGGPGPASWPSQRRQRLREFRRNQCVPDAKRPGKRFNPSPRCPHGTVGGHDNWGCQCLIVPGTEHRPWVEHTGDVVTPAQLFWPRLGCEPVKVREDRNRRARNRERRALDLLLDAAREVAREITPPDGIPLGPAQAREKLVEHILANPDRVKRGRRRRDP